jgi:Asp-tRNA(Asn)/Glu-tRNA(Gln) amidotransferase A subunit family amidase
MPEVEPAMAAAFHNALAMLRRSGISVRPVAVSEMLDKLNEAASTVEAYEGARFHEQRYKEYGSGLAELADLVKKGLELSLERYDEARRYIAECKARMAEMYKATEITPNAYLAQLFIHRDANCILRLLIINASSRPIIPLRNSPCRSTTWRAALSSSCRLE